MRPAAGTSQCTLASNRQLVLQHSAPPCAAFQPHASGRTARRGRGRSQAGWSRRYGTAGSTSRAPIALASSGQDDGIALKGLKELAALDEFIDTLIAAKSQDELFQLVAQNLLSCDQKFWVRLATRSDSAANDEEKERLQALASTVMYIVDALVKKTEGQLSESAAVLQDILVAAAEEDGQWRMPLSKAKIAAMRAAMERWAEEGQVDEALLSNAFAWMRKANEDGLDGMVALIQKVLQLYAARTLGGSGGGEGADGAVSRVLAADEAEWEDVIRQAADEGSCSEPSFMEALQRRMEGTVLNQASGSYAQRVQAEYLKEVEGRAQQVFKQLAGRT